MDKTELRALSCGISVIDSTRETPVLASWPPKVGEEADVNAHGLEIAD